jgi:hypothetical protein
MARPCSICVRADAPELNELLQSGRSARSVAAAFSLSEDALGRHARGHLNRPVASASPPPTGVAPLDELIDALRVRALAGNPSDTREYRLALATQQAERAGAVATHDLVNDPEWITLRSLVLAALAPFPAARIAVADAIREAGS